MRRHVPRLHRLRCWLGVPVIRFKDPTGGDPFLGGPAWIPVCAACEEQLYSARAERALAYALRGARYRARQENAA